MFARLLRSGLDRLCLSAGLALVMGFAGPVWAGTSAQRQAVEAPKPVYYDLRYRFQSGETIHFVVEQRTILSAQQADAREISENSSTEHKHYRVVSVDQDGAAVLESTFDRVQMTAIPDGSAPQSVDSRNPENCPAPYRRVLSMVGKPLARIHVRPDGTVASVKPLVPTGSGAGPERSLRTNAGEDESSKSLLIAMPGSPLQIGDTWQEDFEVPVHLGGGLRQNIALRRKYTLESVDGKIARIQMKTAMLTAVRDPQILSELVMRTPQATIEFDLQRGMILGRRTIFDETVIGAFGPNSLLRARSERTERLLDAAAFAQQVAAAPQTADRRAEKR